MGVIQKSGLAGWSGNAGKYFVNDGPSEFGNNNMNVKHLRLVAFLEQLATTPYRGPGNPKKGNDSEDTAGIGRPFRKSAIWVNEDNGNIFQCSGHSENAATWVTLDLAADDNSSSSSQSSSSSSTNSSSESSSSTNSSSSTSSDSTMTSSSTSSSESSSSTVAGNTSSSSSTVGGNTSSSSESSSSSSA